ncbi:MAG: hypothetical protein ACRD1C_10075 [Terriglobales bacterium]
MAFVRKKGKSYYLVHNVREDGHVRQVHLACLGNRPRVSDEVLQQVREAHPQLQIDWAAVRARAAETFMSPFIDLEGVELLIRSMRTLVQDLAELDFDLLRRRMAERAQTYEAEPRIRGLLEEMAELRNQLDLKLKHHPGAAAAPVPNQGQNTGD